MLACALAATTQAVEARKPALAIAIRARFIVYSLWKSRPQHNARVKANVPMSFREDSAVLSQQMERYHENSIHGRVINDCRSRSPWRGDARSECSNGRQKSIHCHRIGNA